MATAVPSPASSEPRRFSIRLPRPLWIGLTTGVFVFGVVWWQFALPIYRQNVAIREIEVAGGRVDTNIQFPGRARRFVPEPLLTAFDDVFRDAWEVDFSDTSLVDSNLKPLSALPRLEWLRLSRTPVTDNGLRYLHGISSLTDLDLDDTGIGDAGLGHLRNMVRLINLDISNTRVTDSGLKHVERLTNLLYLRLEGTEITDAGLLSLRGLSSLERIDLTGTQVTREGAAELKRSLPNLYIQR